MFVGQYNYLLTTHDMHASERSHSTSEDCQPRMAHGHDSRYEEGFVTQFWHNDDTERSQEGMHETNVNAFLSRFTRRGDGWQDACFSIICAIFRAAILCATVRKANTSVILKKQWIR